MNGLPALPDNLPRIDTARLPAAYEAATVAIAQCAQIDECREWADRMEALASYARQSEDETLLHHAMRIKARAVDRCGEILREIPPSPGGRPKLGEAPPLVSRKQAAVDAGLSPDQAKVALRVNNVPRDLFAKMVDGDRPPTIEKLAEIGTKKRPPVIDQLNGRDPADFEQATRLLGLFTWVDERRAMLDIDAALRGLNANELQTVIAGIRRTILWLTGLEESIDGL